MIIKGHVGSMKIMDGQVNKGNGGSGRRAKKGLVEFRDCLDVRKSSSGSWYLHESHGG